MKVYLSGPMTGIPEYNFPAFEEAAAALRANGHEVLSPHELGVDPAKTWSDYLRADIRMLVECEALVFLPGAGKSKGARLEAHIADELGMPLYPVERLAALKAGEGKVSGWIGVDLDGTLATYDGWHAGEIGEPIPAMVDRVKAWIAKGVEVRVFTARVNRDGEDADVQREMIRDWCMANVGKRLPVTCSKDFGMIELWDDRCVQVVPNTGEALRDLLAVQGVKP